MNRAQRRASERAQRRYVLSCALCGRQFSEAELDDLTIGDVERQHFMRMHDTTYEALGKRVTFQIIDRRRGEVIRRLDG